MFELKNPLKKDKKEEYEFRNWEYFYSAFKFQTKCK